MVQDSVYDAFLEKLLAQSAAIKMGDPTSEETDIGPLISDAAAKRALGQVDESVAMGARCLTGGRRGTGNYFEPTVMVDVTSEMPVMRDEVFAPVAPVCRFSDVDEAIAMANDSIYGLQATVFSSNISNALRVAHRLEVGGVVINGTGAFRPGNVPFGGSKQSGIGRESIVDTVLEMTEEKTIVINNAL
jgi:glyceraldehyde-3-phosphate dehydrogenase (NADP+)